MEGSNLGKPTEWKSQSPNEIWESIQRCRAMMIKELNEDRFLLDKFSSIDSFFNAKDSDYERIKGKED